MTHQTVYLLSLHLTDTRWEEDNASSRYLRVRIIPYCLFLVP